jgi:hypothetical protein
MRHRVAIVSLAVVLAALGTGAYLMRGTCAAFRDEIRELGWADVRADLGLAYRDARLRAAMTAAGWKVLPDRSLGDASLRQPLAVAIDYEDPALGHLVVWVSKQPDRKDLLDYKGQPVVHPVMVMLLRRTKGPRRPTISWTNAASLSDRMVSLTGARAMAPRAGPVRWACPPSPSARASPRRKSCGTTTAAPSEYVLECLAAILSSQQAREDAAESVVRSSYFPTFSVGSSSFARVRSAEARAGSPFAAYTRLRVR